MTLPLLKVAVVGHTNTGKTSLMRTLLRDEAFGEVSDRPAVTREVEGSLLLINSKPAMELYDTPGLEDSIAVLDHLNTLRADRRAEGIDTIQQFLDSPEAHSRFTQEAKALLQVIASDCALYVIDARDRVLGKHRDELAILNMCARPIVPVLNFVAKPEARSSEWRDHLARLNLHAVAEFDTVIVDKLSEQRLFEKMRTLLDRFAPTLDALIDDRKRLRRQLIAGSASLIADMLIDAAAFRISIDRLDKPLIEAATSQLRNAIRQREQQCVDQLLELHRFRREDCEPHDLPITDGKWGIDLYSPEAMKHYGIRAGSGAAAGAMAGAIFDVLTGGLSLGAGTATGAALGGAIGGHGLGKRILDKVRGKSEVQCDDATLLLLKAREVALTQALLHRGHASQGPVRKEERGASEAGSTVLDFIQVVRSRADWSNIHEAHGHDAQRYVVQQKLAALLEQDIRTTSGAS